MRIRSKTMMGRIGEHGELNLHWDALTAFLQTHKGKVAIVRVELQPVEASEKTKNYYFGYVVPEMQSAIMEAGEYKSKEDTDLFLRSCCPICYDEKRVDGTWVRRVKEFEELDQCECGDFIDFVKQFAAENYYKIIDDPC